MCRPGSAHHSAGSISAGPITGTLQPSMETWTNSSCPDIPARVATEGRTVANQPRKAVRRMPPASTGWGRLMPTAHSRWNSSLWSLWSFNERHTAAHTFPRPGGPKRHGEHGRGGWSWSYSRFHPDNSERPLLGEPPSSHRSRRDQKGTEQDRLCVQSISCLPHPRPTSSPSRGMRGTPLFPPR
jgi:hypothetical protein